MDYLRTIPLRIFCTFLAMTVIPALVIYMLSGLRKTLGTIWTMFYEFTRRYIKKKLANLHPRTIFDRVFNL